MDRDPASFRAASTAAASVTQLAVLVIVGAWVGGRLDGSLDTSPGFLLFGLGGGAALGFFLLARSMAKLEPQLDPKPDPQPDPPPDDGPDDPPPDAE